MNAKKIIVCLLLLVCLLPSIQATTQIKQAGSDALGFSFATTSATYYPTRGSMGMLVIDIDNEYEEAGNTIEVYFEVNAEFDYSGLPNGMGSGNAILYDVGDATTIADSEIALGEVGPNRERSSDLYDYFDGNGAVTIYPQLKAGSSTTSVNQAWRMVIIQSGTNITKTVTYIPIGSNQAVSSGTYAEITYPKWWDFNALDYSGTIGVNFCATITDEGDADEMFAELYDKTASSAVTGSEVSTTSDTEVYLCSDDLSGNLTNGNRLTTYVKRGTTGTGIIRNAFLKIVQTSMPTDGTAKLKTVMQHSNKYWTRAGNYISQKFEHEYDPNDWSQATIDYKGEYIIRATARFLKLGKVHLTDDLVEITNSEAWTTSSSYALFTTSSLTAPATASEIDDGLGAGTGSTAYITSGRSILTVTGIGAVPPVTIVEVKELYPLFVNPFKPIELNIMKYIFLLFERFFYD